MKLPGLGIATLLISSLCPLFAQTNLANISGVVTDAQGAVVATAIVTANNVATGVKTQAHSNDAGFFLLTNLPIGNYTLIVEREGFHRYVRDSITLATGQSLALDVQLQIGAVSENVTVTGAPPIIETRTSDISQVVETKSIEDIPLGDRRLFNIMAFVAGGAFVDYNSNLRPNFTLAGGRTQSQNVWIDGGTGQNMRLGIGQIDVDPPVDTVQEVKVLSNNYAAEYGGSAGGVVIANTKSGTNLYHGTLSEYLRNDKLDAPGFFAPIANGKKTEPPLRYNVFGGTLGGPIRRNKTFFFVSYEGSYRHTGAISTLTVPSVLQRSGDFSQTLTTAGVLIPIYDPGTTVTAAGKTTRLPFAGNIIPANQVDPVAAKLMPFYPLPNRAADNLAGANNFRANLVNGIDRKNLMAKVDHNLGSKDRFVGRYIYTNDNFYNSSVYPDPGAEPASDAPKHYQNFYGSWTRVISPNLLNEFRGTYVNRYIHFITKGVGGDYPDKLGLKGVSNYAFPQFSPAGFANVGAGGAERRQFPTQQYQFVDNASWVHGKHYVKFGGEARRSSNVEVDPTTPSGAFGFATTPTSLPGVASSGNGLASLMVGFPTSFSLLTTEALDRRSWYFAAFVQDDWQVTKSLTLNVGLRWETDTPIVDGANRMNGFDASAINPVSGTPGVVKFAGIGGWPSSPFPWDWNNFGPRFGFAWKPFNSSGTVVRGGYGIFFAHPFDSAAPNAASLGYSLSASINSPDNGITAPFLLRNGVPPVSAAAPVLNDSFGAVPVGGTPNTAVSVYDPGHREGYAQQFNLGIEHSLPGSSMISVSYVANLGRKLPSTAVNIDQILPQLLGPAHQSQKDRPYAQFSGVTYNLPSWGVSSYNAGIVRFEKRYSGGLNIVSSYTFSKFLSNIGEEGDVFGARGGYSDFYNRRSDYGPEGNDIRHHFIFSSVYELPFGNGKPYLARNPLRYLVGGWAIGNVTTVQSGAPFTVTTQTNSTNAFSAGAQRASVLRNPNLPSSQQTVNLWFDTSAFTQPALFTFGNQSPGLGRSAGLVDFDFSIQRYFRIRERARLQFRGELFNIFNHTNLGNPGNVFGSATFGIVNSARSARTVQLGLRLSF